MNKVTLKSISKTLIVALLFSAAMACNNSSETKETATDSSQLRAAPDSVAMDTASTRPIVKPVDNQGSPGE